MRYLKMFKGFSSDSDIEKKIGDIWKVDPYEFNDYDYTWRYKTKFIG